MVFSFYCFLVSLMIFIKFKSLIKHDVYNSVSVSGKTTWEEVTVAYSEVVVSATRDKITYLPKTKCGLRAK
jgi:hypothetical protein